MTKPGVAALASLVFPGLGHFLVGRPVRAVFALASTVGLFGIAFLALGDRLWHLSPVPLSGLSRYFPVLLQPEFVNFGCTTVAALVDGPVGDARHMQLPRAGEHLWMFVSAASSYAAVFWAADALWIAGAARNRKVAPAFAAFVSWILPGAGHVLGGQRSKGMLIGAVVIGMFVLGLLLGAGHSVDRPQMPFWWAGQSVFGGGVAFAALFTGPLQMESYPPLLDLGVILCTIAGLMNAIVITDAWTVAENGTSANEGAGAPSEVVA